MNLFFHNVPITLICSNCKTGQFIFNYNNRKCAHCGVEIVVNEAEVNKLLVEALVKDRDKWKNCAMMLRQNFNNYMLDSHLKRGEKFFNKFTKES